MEKIKTFFRRYIILSKRLLRKLSFVVILLFIPVLVMATYLAANSGGGGIVTVGLAIEDQDDSLACRIVNSLLNSSGLMDFVLCSTPQDAMDMVKYSSVDAAWIFRSDLESKINKFANHTHKNNAVVSVIQREDSVLLRLSHEKLNAALYPYISYDLYRIFLNGYTKIPAFSEKETQAFYNAIDAQGADLFDFVYLDQPPGRAHQSGEKTINFLVSPLRGLLAVMIVFAGVAAAMYYMQDESSGVFDRSSQSSGFALDFLYHISAVVMVAVAALAALLLSRMTIGLGYELICLLLYCICTVGFCMCLRLLLGKIQLFSAFSTLLIVATAVLCPIFFMVPHLPAVQYLLPTYYYLNAFSNTRFVLYMLVYSVCLYLLAFALHKLKSKLKK